MVEKMELTMIISNSKTFEFLDYVKKLFHDRSEDFNTVVNYQLQKVLSLHINESEINFTQLLREMQGVFPVELHNLIKSTSNVSYFVNEELEGNRKSGWHQLAENANLPFPHPANYEWRYTEESAKLIVEHIKSLHIPDIKICCLGTPSVALELVRNGMGRNTTFLDINEPLKKLIERVYDDSGITCKTYDAQNMPSSKFKGEFHIVVTNPPWYLDYYELFTSRAIEFLKESGKVITPLFPPLSRNKALKDLDIFRRFLEKSNCKKIKSLGTVEFEMPEFEKAVLKANNTPLPQSNWRNAELVELTFEEDKESLIKKNIRLEKRRWLRDVDDKLAYVIAKPFAWIKQKDGKKRITAERHVLATLSRHNIENMKIDMWDSNNLITIFKEEND